MRLFFGGLVDLELGLNQDLGRLVVVFGGDGTPARPDEGVWRENGEPIQPQFDGRSRCFYLSPFGPPDLGEEWNFRIQYEFTDDDEFFELREAELQLSHYGDMWCVELRTSTGFSMCLPLDGPPTALRAIS